MEVVINISVPIFLAFLLTLGAEAQSYLESSHLPKAAFHHEIFYPNEFFSQGPTGFRGVPITTRNAGFRFGLRPAQAPFLLQQPQHHSAGNLFIRRSPAPAVRLFTPNTLEQPAETLGQIQNYNKAIEEEAREAERAENDIAARHPFASGSRELHQGISGPATDDADSDGPAPKSYVEVQVQGDKEFNYGYRI